MPRKRNSEPQWDLLAENSATQLGFFTKDEAQEAGISSALLAHHSKVGKVEHVYRGVYRFPHVPHDDLEDLVALWLLSAREGVFSHETALALLQLSDVLPNSVHLMVPTRWRRRRFPVHTELHYVSEMPTEIQWFGAVPITRTMRTLQDCQAMHTPPELIAQAVTQAVARGLITRSEAEQLRVQT